MELADIVRVKNTGNETWTDKFNNQRFVADPGREVIVPFAALCLWLGNPDARDKPSGQAQRRHEYNRLLIRYGGSENVAHAKFPTLEAFDFDGNKIITVLDDPDGKGVHEASSTLEEKELLQAKIDEMSRQMTQMQQRMDDHNYDEPLSEDVQEDNPSKVPTGSRVSTPE